MLECWEEDVDKRCTIHYLVTQIESRLAAKYNHMRRNYSSDSYPAETSIENEKNSSDESDPHPYNVLADTVLEVERQPARHDDDQTYSEFILPSTANCEEWRHVGSTVALQNPVIIQPETHVGNKHTPYSGATDTCAISIPAIQNGGVKEIAGIDTLQSHVTMTARDKLSQNCVRQHSARSNGPEHRNDSDTTHNPGDTSSSDSQSSTEGLAGETSRAISFNHSGNATFEAGDYQCCETTI